MALDNGDIAVLETTRERANRAFVSCHVELSKLKET